VLDYFDAFLIGLTATPDKRTFGFFKENIVSEYPHERAVADGVNVGYDVLAELARRYGAGKPRNRFAGETVDVLLDGVRVLLLSPTTYMNRSGRSVAEAAGFSSSARKI